MRSCVHNNLIKTFIFATVSAVEGMVVVYGSGNHDSDRGGGRCLEVVIVTGWIWVFVTLVEL